MLISELNCGMIQTLGGLLPRSQRFASTTNRLRRLIPSSVDAAANIVSRVPSAVSSGVSGYIDSIPERLRAFLGSRRTIDEDVMHLTNVQFQLLSSGSDYLLLCYTDGLQIVDITCAATAHGDFNVREVFSTGIPDGVSSAVIMDFPSPAGETPTRTRRYVAYIPLTCCGEVRVIDTSNMELRHRIEVPGPITTLHTDVEEGRRVLAVVSPRQLRLYEIHHPKPHDQNMAVSRLATLPLHPVATKPPCALSGRWIWFADGRSASVPISKMESTGGESTLRGLISHRKSHWIFPAGHLACYDWTIQRYVARHKIIFPLEETLSSSEDGSATPGMSVVSHVHARKRERWLDCGDSPRPSRGESDADDSSDSAFEDDGHTYTKKKNEETIGQIALSPNGKYVAVCSQSASHVCLYSILESGNTSQEGRNRRVCSPAEPNEPGSVRTAVSQDDAFKEPQRTEGRKRYRLAVALLSSRRTTPTLSALTDVITPNQSARKIQQIGHLLLRRLRPSTEESICYSLALSDCLEAAVSQKCMLRQQNSCKYVLLSHLLGPCVSVLNMLIGRF